jgi:hypothetical protein
MIRVRDERPSDLAEFDRGFQVIEFARGARAFSRGLRADGTAGAE